MDILEEIKKHAEQLRKEEDIQGIKEGEASKLVQDLDKLETYIQAREAKAMLSGFSDGYMKGIANRRYQKDIRTEEWEEIRDQQENEERLYSQNQQEEA